MKKYDPKKIELKWKESWDNSSLYTAEDYSKKEKQYILDMFPYPSGDGLHLGHAENYVATDIYSRYKRMQGFNVLHPIGWDAFGLPAENFAIKTGVHPNKKTHENIDNFKKQIKSLGISYDWEREIDTSSSEYYEWTQWWFLLLYKNGLAYKKRAKVNWCDSCKTVLANEQSENGICERCKNEVIQKDLEQWFFKITDYAEELIDDLDNVDWPSSTVASQRNWIGKSEGVEFEMPITGTDEKLDQKLLVYTTRVDTVFGMTYAVIAPEHPLVEILKENIKNKKAVEDYQKASAKKTDLERTELAKEKTGVILKGITAINPFTNKEVPLYLGDYVLASYGTGSVMAVPAHDERDFEFAKQYDLPIIESVSGGDIKKEAYTRDGVLVESGEFTGLSSIEAREKMAFWLEKKGFGKKKINYRLRDWLVSRQRYWGAPIPIVYDPQGNAHPVPEEHLPWILPTDVEFKPTGVSPLAASQELLERTEKIFGKGWKPEVDTMDTFVCSSWYYFRFADPRNIDKFASPDLIKKWLPVDMYMGGAEHTVLHLMYARFFTKVLNKLGVIDFNEPFVKLRHQGMVLAEDGRKMSKSLGNVINPDDIISIYGADSLRLHTMFMGPLEDMKPWNGETIIGPRRLLERIWQFQDKVSEDGEQNQTLLHQTIKKITNDIETFSYNTAISAMMILANDMEKRKSISLSEYKIFIKLLAPFAPFMTEEIWHELKKHGSIHGMDWPFFDESKTLENTITIAIQINGKVRDDMKIKRDLSEEEVKEQALDREVVKKWTDGKEIKKVIYVKGKILNIVVA